MDMEQCHTLHTGAKKKKEKKNLTSIKDRMSTDFKLTFMMSNKIYQSYDCPKTQSGVCDF